MLGRHAVRFAPLTGGDLSQIWRATLDDGHSVVVKHHPLAAIEERMLREIAAAGAPAPGVLGADSNILVIEDLPVNGRLGDAWTSLGACLAVLHTATGNSYGWHDDYAFGDVAINNAASDDWPSFWGERRLLTHMSHLPPTLFKRIERLAAGLGNRLPSNPAASLLHGDLWGGNVLVYDREISGLIDPACYYGHAEVDIAMLGLFDRPSMAFFQAYGALDNGHEERLAIYTLWPALVHLRLFGNAYLSMIDALLARLGV